MRRLLIIPLAMLLLLGGAILWSSSGQAPRADFTFINRGEIGTLDPNRMSWMQDIRIGYALWEGLYALDPQTLDPVPGAADKIDLSPDRTVYTFHLRDDGRWSDGSPVTPGDFTFAWKRMLEEPGDYTYLLYYIKGAEAYQKAFHAGSADFSTVGIKDAGGSNLVVSLKHPVSYFPEVCAFPPTFPLNEKSMLRFREPYKDEETGLPRNRYDQVFTRPPNLVTNGPFVLEAWQFKKNMRLRKNPYYWDRARVRSETIEMIDAVDPAWAYLDYNQGHVDWLADVSGQIAAELKAKKREDLRLFPGFGTYFYSVNCQPTLPGGKPNPLADARVRRALAMSLDKKVIVETITRMGEAPADGYVPPGVFPGYPSPPGITDDVAAARQLLADAGYPEGRGFPRQALLFNNDFPHGEIAQVVRRQWQHNLGIDFDLEPVELKVFRQKLHAKDYAVARASWFGDYKDVSTFTDKYLSTSENNDSGWVSKKYDDLLHDAEWDADPNPGHRLGTLSEAEQVLCDEAPIIPVFYYNNAYLFRDNVKGIPLNPRNMLNFKSVYIER